MNRFSDERNKIKSVIFLSQRKDFFSYHAIMQRTTALGKRVGCALFPAAFQEVFA